MINLKLSHHVPFFKRTQHPSALTLILESGFRECALRADIAFLIEVPSFAHVFDTHILTAHSTHARFSRTSTHKILTPLLSVLQRRKMTGGVNSSSSSSSSRVSESSPLFASSRSHSDCNYSQHNLSLPSSPTPPHTNTATHNSTTTKSTHNSTTTTTTTTTAPCSFSSTPTLLVLALHLLLLLLIPPSAHGVCPSSCPIQLMNETCVVGSNYSLACCFGASNWTAGLGIACALAGELPQTYSGNIENAAMAGFVYGSAPFWSTLSTIKVLYVEVCCVRVYCVRVCCVRVCAVCCVLCVRCGNLY